MLRTQWIRLEPSRPPTSTDFCLPQSSILRGVSFTSTKSQLKMPLLPPKRHCPRLDVPSELTPKKQTRLRTTTKANRQNAGRTPPRPWLLLHIRCQFLSFLQKGVRGSRRDRCVRTCECTCTHTHTHRLHYLPLTSLWHVITETYNMPGTVLRVGIQHHSTKRKILSPIKVLFVCVCVLGRDTDPS